MPYAEGSNVHFNISLDNHRSAFDRLGRIATQHALTTQQIEVANDGKSAKAVTYFNGYHFGREKHTGEVLSAYGAYHDELVPTANGWRISRREVKFTARIGDEDIMSDR